MIPHPKTISKIIDEIEERKSKAKTHYCPTCDAPVATGHADGNVGIIRDLRARIGALEAHVGEAEVNGFIYHARERRITSWLEKARLILKGE